MSSYEELIREIESLHEDLHVDDIDKDTIDIIYYGIDTDDLLYDIDNILLALDKNYLLYNIRVATEEYKGNKSFFMLLSYMVNIGEDIESEEEMYQKTRDQREEDIQDDNAMRAKDMRL